MAASTKTTHFANTYGNLLLAVVLEPQEVGRRIKAAREQKGWTQLQFALEAHVSPSSVARWESGKLPPVRELMRIAEVLGVPAGELVEDVSDDGERVFQKEIREELAGLRADVRRVLALQGQPAGTARKPRAKRESHG